MVLFQRITATEIATLVATSRNSTISKENSCATATPTILNHTSNGSISTIAATTRSSKWMSRIAIMKTTIITACQCREILKATQRIGPRCLMARAAISRLQMSDMAVVILGTEVATTPPSTHSLSNMVEDNLNTCSSQECSNIKPTALPISTSSATMLELQVVLTM